MPKPPLPRAFAAFLALAVLLGLALCSAASHAPPQDLAAADRLFSEKSYAGALKIYERLLKAGIVPAARRDEVEYRVAVSLGKSQQWDRAMERSLAFVKAHRGSVWEPRALYWLGRLYLAVPHQGFRVGKRLYRGDNVPQTAPAEKPEAINLAEQDLQNARDAFEAARVFFPAYRKASHTEGEEIQLDFDLARILFARDLNAWAAKQKWLPPSDGSWTVEGVEPYAPEWPVPKKIVFLYEQIRLLAATSARPHQAALALFGKALWLRQYQALMANAAVRWENQKPVRIPYPYQDLHPNEVLRQLVHDFPQDPTRDQAQFTLASFVEADGQFLAALAEYRRLIEERPQSKWAIDARYNSDVILHRNLLIDAPPSQTAGRPARIRFSARNVETVHFTAYRVNLPAVLARPEHLSNPDVNFATFPGNFGGVAAARRFYGPRVAAWDVPTGDRGDHRSLTREVATPLKEVGAYAVEASAPGISAATIVLVTDLVLAQKLHRDGVLLFAANARTGQPVAGVDLVVKQIWNTGNKQLATAVRRRTAADGTASVPLVRAAGRQYFMVETLAYKGSRCAITGRTGGNDGGDNPARSLVYSTTDRAVYRPMQVVHYRELVLQRERGDLKPLAGRHVAVMVRDPNGQEVFHKTETSSAFGSVNGDFPLPEEAPLGEYQIDVTVPGQNNQAPENGSNRFRVEEYKKPEFEITVTPAAERVRLGETTRAKVHAEYYFGGPVPKARVSYRIYRNYYAQTYTFPRPFDFLTRSWNQGDYNTNYRQGEVIAQGDTLTDEKGDAQVAFSTSAVGSQWKDYDLSFTIDADVQDSSRRVISGSGEVKATKHDVAVFLNYPHGFATRGDRVDVEIVTVNPSNQPVSVPGTAKVFREPETPDGHEHLVHQEPLKTDAHGRAFLHWSNESGGEFRVAFETRDTAKQTVEGSLALWVDGPELAQGRFLFRNVFLAVKEPYYEEGQTAKVLLVTPAAGCAVLLTREANNEILERRVVRVPGRSMVLPVPLAKRDVPNVYLSAIVIRDGQLFQATQELFVPPARQFTTVTVHADKERYRPGEKATLHLQARDWKNRPLETELSVSVSDASLAYIQKDYAPDIRAYFYGDRRSQSVEAAGSTGAQFDSTDEDSQPSKRYALHEWLLPDGMGQLPEWPGERGGFGRREDALHGGGRRLARAGGMPSGAMGGESLMSDVTIVNAASATPMAPAAASARLGTVVLGYSLDNSLVVRHGGGWSENYKAPAGGLAAAAVRSHFADTAFWTPAVITDAQGRATVQVTWPDNLTRWRAVAVGASMAAQVGSGEASIATKKDLLVRLEAPRFFVERDQVTVSAGVHNYLPAGAHVKVHLDLDGGTAIRYAWAARMRDDLRRGEQWIDIPKDGERRVDWPLKIEREGTLKVRVTAQSSAESDATEATFPVLVHGVERQVAKSGALRDRNQEQVSIELPAARKPGSSELVVQLNPSLAATMLDALPYLADYPYGCIEQTMSRFLPSVVVAKTLKDAGYDLAALRKRARLLEQRAVEDARHAPDPVKNSPYTYPNGRPGTMRLPVMASATERWRSPVFDAAELDNMVRSGLAKIHSFQHEDGGWGWWPGDSSDPYMTAYVLQGLLTCRDASTPVDAGMITRGLDFLRGRFLEDEDVHRMAFEARVLAMEPRLRPSIRPLTTGRLYQRRERLSAYSKALLALALHDLGEAAKAGVLLRNLESTVAIDAANGTASWEAGGTDWWRWYNDRVETNAAALEAYLAIAPKETRIPSMLVKWLVNNRRGSIWNSTRETALAVTALAQYARANRELDPEYTLTVDFAGKVRREYNVTRENALFFDNSFVVPDELLETGQQPLTITKNGAGALYWSAYTRYFSLEEPIRGTGNEIFVHRRVFRLIPGTASGTPAPQETNEERPNPFLTGRYDLLGEGGVWVEPEPTEGGPRYEREPLNDGDTVTSGDLLEVELQLEAKNDYDYLVFEDMKPAGCEPVEVRSGAHGGSVYSNMELRDEKVAFFLASLPQGTRTLSYRLRAEVPGQFHVLPTNGYAMYAPDLRCLSDEQRLVVRDRR